MLWGTSFLFIKVGLEALPPLQVALARCLLGAVTLVLLVLVRRERLPRGWPLWGHLFLAGLLFNSVPFALFAYGETEVSSVLAGLFNATTPLFATLAVLALVPQERPSRERVVGVLVGFAGVLVVLGVWRSLGGGALIGGLACIGATACYGLGFAHNRLFLSGRPESGPVLASGQVLMGSAQLLLVTPFVTSLPGDVPLRVVGAMLALGVLGTGVAYVLNYTVIRAAGPTTASTVTYLIPLVATLAGVLVLGEQLHWNEPVGGVVVLLGVAVAQGRLGRRRPPEAAATSPG